MKALLKISLTLILSLISVLAMAESQDLSPSERIVDYKGSYVILPNGSLEVTETIKVNVTNAKIKHGIYRDIPSIYIGEHGKASKVTFTIHEVLRDGHSEPYSIIDIKNAKRIYIANPDTILKPGVHTYVISYVTHNQLELFDKYDELHWSVTGNGWVLPIDRVQVELTLPKGAALLKAEAYTDLKGKTVQDYSVSVSPSGKVMFTSTHPLVNQENFIIRAMWPKGFITEDPSSKLKSSMQN